MEKYKYIQRSTETIKDEIAFQSTLNNLAKEGYKVVSHQVVLSPARFADDEHIIINIVIMAHIDD